MDVGVPVAGDGVVGVATVVACVVIDSVLMSGVKVVIAKDKSTSAGRMEHGVE